MGIVIVLIILALIFGGVGLLIEGLFWLLIIGLVLLAIGAFMGLRGRGSGRGTGAGRGPGTGI